jgi:hypothetical protein
MAHLVQTTTHGPLLSHILQSWCDPVTDGPTYCCGPPTAMAHLLLWPTFCHGPLTTDQVTHLLPRPTYCRPVGPPTADLLAQTTIHQVAHQLPLNFETEVNRGNTKYYNGWALVHLATLQSKTSGNWFSVNCPSRGA